MIDLVDRRSVEVYDALLGERIAEFTYEFHRGLLAVDSRDRLMIACPRSRLFTILSPSGKVISRWSMRPDLVPIASAADSAGRVWVCGELV